MDSGSKDDSSSDEEDFIFGIDFSNLNVDGVVFEDEDKSIEASHSNELRKTSSVTSFSITIQNLLQPTNDNNKTKDRCHDSTEGLFRWASNMGASLEKIECYKDTYGGRGLKISSQEDIVVGEVVAVLPRSLRIGQNVACDRIGLPKNTPDLTSLSILLLDLLRNDNDPLCHYAKSLPQECHNAVFMTEQEQTYWSDKGEEYFRAIHKVREQAESCVQYINDCLMGLSAAEDHSNSSSGVFPSSKSAIYWAISMVQSRTHGFGSQRSRWLTPILDFCNHSSLPNCRLEGDSSGSLILRAVLPIKTGDEVTIDYQVSEDAKLVATYGFSLLYPMPSW
jgi:hypothetical protein